jgi:hypothetical protein
MFVEAKKGIPKTQLGFSLDQQEVFRFSDQLGQAPTLAYQFGVKGWRMECDRSRVKIECCSEAYIYPEILLLVEF